MTSERLIQILVGSGCIAAAIYLIVRNQYEQFQYSPCNPNNARIPCPPDLGWNETYSPPDEPKIPSDQIIGFMYPPSASGYMNTAYTFPPRNNNGKPFTAIFNTPPLYAEFNHKMPSCWMTKVPYE
jgi:hypothetical protein